MVLTHEDELLELRKEWDRLHTESGGALFQSFRWISTWWDVYKEKFQMRVLALWDGGRLVGVAPCYVEVKKLGPYGLWRLRMMGEFETSGQYAPLCLKECVEDVAVASSDFFGRLLRRREIDVIDFHHIATTSEIRERIIRRIRSQGLFVRHRAHSAAHLVLKNPADWEGYLRLLSRPDREMRIKREQTLVRRGAEIEMIPCAGDETAFNDFVVLHNKAMAARSLEGHFLGKERYGEFLKRVTVGSDCEETPRWFFYRQGTARFAGLLAFYCGDACCLYLSGRDPDHALARWSPGIVLITVAVRDSIVRGCKMVDFVEGDTPYKFTLGATDEGFARTSITSPLPMKLSIMLYLAVVILRESRFWARRVEPLYHHLAFRRFQRQNHPRFSDPHQAARQDQQS